MKKPVLIGISGGSGSGKTTLARGLGELTSSLGSVVIAQDNYYRGLPPDLHAENYNFDEPSALDLPLLAEHLAMLKAGRKVQMPIYDFQSHQRKTETIPLSPQTLVIVEGLFLFSLAALRDLFDLRFFVDVPTQERLRRRILRDMKERGRTEEDVRQQFDRQVEPMYVRHVLPTREYAGFIFHLPHPNDRVYCEQVVEMWRLTEKSITG